MDCIVTDVDKYKVIKLSGRIDWESARTLDKEIERLIGGGAYNLVFNLDEVSFICSGGIGALVYNLNKVKKMGGGIYIISSNDYVNYIFETLKFDVVFEGFLFDSFEKFTAEVLGKSAEKTS